MSNLSLDKSKTALVVIDLQKGIVGRKTAPHAAAEVVQNASTLADAFRKNGMPVFLVRVMSSPDCKDALRPRADASMQMSALPPDWAEIVPELGPKPRRLSHHQVPVVWPSRVRTVVGQAPLDGIAQFYTSRPTRLELFSRFNLDNLNFRHRT